MAAGLDFDRFSRRNQAAAADAHKGIYRAIRMFNNNA